MINKNISLSEFFEKYVLINGEKPTQLQIENCKYFEKIQNEGGFVGRIWKRTNGFSNIIIKNRKDGYKFPHPKH